MVLKAGVVSLVLLLASRVLGVVRESVQAGVFGTSGLGDVAVLMLTLPDWLASLLVSGALAYVLLPLWAQQPAASHALIQRKVAVRLLLGGLMLALAVWGLQARAVSWLAAGLPAELRDVAAAGLGWSALAIPWAFLAALWVTRLQHERDFLGMYAANLVVNAALIAALATLVARPDAGFAIRHLGMWLMGAMLLRLCWLGWRQRSQDPLESSPQSGAVPLPHATIWLWAALSAGLPLALPFAARSLASHAGEGQLATFNYAWKLVELPLVLAIQLVASLAFPSITRVFAQGVDPGPTLRRAFALAWVLGCAAAAALLAGAPAIARLLFGWGRMTPDSITRVADWAAIGAWGLLPQALIAVALTVLATQRRMRPVVVAYAAAMVVFLLAGQWTAGDGGRLMLALNLAMAGVAVACLVALGRQAVSWLSWRTVMVPAGVLLLLQGLRAQGLLALGQGVQAGLAAAMVAAILVIGAAWLASVDVRAALRR